MKKYSGFILCLLCLMTSGLFATEANDATNKMLIEIKNTGNFTKVSDGKLKDDVNNLGKLVLKVRNTGRLHTVPKTPEKFREVYPTLAEELNQSEINMLLPNIFSAATPPNTPVSTPVQKSFSGSPYFQPFVFKTEKHEELIRPFVHGEDYNEYLNKLKNLAALVNVLRDAKRRILDDKSNKHGFMVEKQIDISILLLQGKARQSLQGQSGIDFWDNFIVRIPSRNEFSVLRGELESIDREIIKIILKYVVIKSF